MTLAKQLNSLLKPGAYIQDGEKQPLVQHFKEAANWLIAKAQQGSNLFHSMNCLNLLWGE